MQMGRFFCFKMIINTKKIKKYAKLKRWHKKK